MDIATLFGLISSFGLVASAVLLGGSASAFIDIPSVLIVIGGTFGVTTIGYTFGEILRAQPLIIKTIISKSTDSGEAAIEVIRLAEQARKEGVLVLQKVLPSLEDEPFLYKALNLVVDGTPSDEIERVMRAEIDAMGMRHGKGYGIYKKAGEIAPAMGLIGTLVGLVQMLGNLEDPSSIGPAMAVALLTTFYGAVLANMVFNPLAAKLERNSDEEILLYRIYLLGSLSISRQENPRRLEMLINTLLPPNKRISYFE